MNKIAVTLLLLALTCCVLALPVHPGPLAFDNVTVSTIYQFPESGHWFENLAVRPNGMILATELTAPKLWLINPSNPRKVNANTDDDSGTIRLVHEFPEYLGLLGIAEYEHDVFAIIAGNFSIVEGFKSYMGTYAVWSIDFNTEEGPKIEKLADVTDGFFMNGMAYLKGDNSLLLADSDLGCIRKLQLDTKEVSFWISDPYMEKVNSTAPDGINGLKVYGDELWFTRGYDSLVAKFSISESAVPLSSVDIVGVGLNSTWTMDDLVVDSLGRAYVAIPFQNMIARFDGSGQSPIIIAGEINSTQIAEPTALAFARKNGGVVDESILYVTTGGAIGDPIDGSITIGGQVIGIRL